ncbi:hypothetical protein [Dactylosporangium matsuzakiense]|uniref:hypothetical protein n=1 Tax=Dactylosporangium matsuzakiense TaxID=53360 RepID=UPI0021C41154|nr:hypothetical protein [Dactylosporangium matsuzakiense]UWZ42829.1 hypothetical protein Dmats_35685 [Dactylosporangium matsuzakiense]
MSDPSATAMTYTECAAVLSGLGLPVRFSIAQLIAVVQERRGRPLQLIPRDLPSLSPHGLWLAMETNDYVVYDSNAGLVRQHQIIGHEIGHMLFDDGAEAGLMQRTSYERPIERRTEIFGTVVLERVHDWGAASERAHADPSLAVRLSTMLEGGTGGAGEAQDHRSPTEYAGARVWARSADDCTEPCDGCAYLGSIDGRRHRRASLRHILGA